MTTFHRAGIVSGIVGVLFVAMGVWVALPLIEAGASADVMVPELLGIAIKATLALAFAAVMVAAIRLERMRMARWRRAQNITSANDNDKRRRRRAA